MQIDLEAKEWVVGCKFTLAKNHGKEQSYSKQRSAGYLRKSPCVTAPNTHFSSYYSSFRALHVLDVFGTNIRDHELLALSKLFHFLAFDLAFCKDLTSHGLWLRAIGLASGGSPWITFHAVNNEGSIFSGG